MTARILPALLVLLVIAAGALVLMVASVRGFAPCGAHCQWELSTSHGLPFWQAVR